MKISVKSQDLAAAQTDIVAVTFVDGKIQKNSPLDKINKALSGDIEKILAKEKFKGTPAQSKLLHTGGRLNATYVLILGLGEKKNFNLDTIRKCGAAIQGVAKQVHAETVAAEIPAYGFKGVGADDVAQALAEGVLLAGYSFDRYKKNPEKSELKELALHVAKAGFAGRAQKGVAEAELLAEAVNLARDMINTPSNDMTPEALAKTAQGLKGIRTKIHNLAQIEKLKMGSFLSVGHGSLKNPPYFIEMHYTPKAKPKKKVALIGKGVTFDTGGYSIKPAKSMETMKDDMSGGAAVIALMSILPRLAPSVAVSGYVAATENMVDGHAQKPGDICQAMDGTTIEVLNTDAEGRLTLADAILYAKKAEPDYMIDMATLTGACLVSLGLLYSGLMGNDEDLQNKILQASKFTGENMWRLPLPEEYREDLKSPVADLKNIGGAYGGTLTAGLFLDHFAKGVKWAHLDIAGPAWTDKPLPYTPRGGTGVMVRTMARFLKQF